MKERNGEYFQYDDYPFKIPKSPYYAKKDKQLEYESPKKKKSPNKTNTNIINNFLNVGKINHNGQVVISVFKMDSNGKEYLSEEIMPNALITGSDYIATNNQIFRDSQDRPYLKVIKQRINGQTKQIENYEARIYLTNQILRKGGFDKYIPNSRKSGSFNGIIVSALKKSHSSKSQQKEIEVEEKIKEPFIRTRDFIALDPVVRIHSKTNKKYIKVIKQRKNPLSGEIESYECEENVPDVPSMLESDLNIKESNVWITGGHIFRVVVRYVPSDGQLINVECLQELAPAHKKQDQQQTTNDRMNQNYSSNQQQQQQFRNIKSIKVIKNELNPKTLLYEEFINEQDVPEQAIITNNYICIDTTVYRKEGSGRYYYHAYKPKRQYAYDSPNPKDQIYFECEEEVPEYEEYSIPTFEIKKIPKNDKGIPVLKVFNSVPDNYGVTKEIEEEQEIHSQAVAGNDYIVPNQCIYRNRNGNTFINVIRARKNTEINVFEYYIRKEVIPDTGSDKRHRKVIRERTNSLNQNEEFLIEDDNQKSSQPKVFTRCIRKQWNPFTSRYELYDCIEEVPSSYQDKYGRYMISIIKDVRTRNGKIEKFETTKELTPTNNSDFLDLKVKFIRKTITVMHIGKNPKTGLAEVVNQKEEIYEPEFIQSSKPKMPPNYVEREVSVTRISLDELTGKPTMCEDTVSVFEPLDADPILSKWEKNVTKRSPIKLQHMKSNSMQALLIPERKFNSPLIQPDPLYADLSASPQVNKLTDMFNSEVLTPEDSRRRLRRQNLRQTKEIRNYYSKQERKRKRRSMEPQTYDDFFSFINDDIEPFTKKHKKRDHRKNHTIFGVLDIPEESENSINDIGKKIRNSNTKSRRKSLDITELVNSSRRSKSVEPNNDKIISSKDNDKIKKLKKKEKSKSKESEKEKSKKDKSKDKEGSKHHKHHKHNHDDKEKKERTKSVEKKKDDKKERTKSVDTKKPIKVESSKSSSKKESAKNVEKKQNSKPESKSSSQKKKEETKSGKTKKASKSRTSSTSKVDSKLSSAVESSSNSKKDSTKKKRKGSRRNSSASKSTSSASRSGSSTSSKGAKKKINTVQSSILLPAKNPEQDLLPNTQNINTKADNNTKLKDIHSDVSSFSSSSYSSIHSEKAPVSSSKNKSESKKEEKIETKYEYEEEEEEEEKKEVIQTNSPLTLNSSPLQLTLPGTQSNQLSPLLSPGLNNNNNLLSLLSPPVPNNSTGNLPLSPTASLQSPTLSLIPNSTSNSNNSFPKLELPTLNNINETSPIQQTKEDANDKESDASSKSSNETYSDNESENAPKVNEYFNPPPEKSSQSSNQSEKEEEDKYSDKDDPPSSNNGISNIASGLSPLPILNLPSNSGIPDISLPQLSLPGSPLSAGNQSSGPPNLSLPTLSLSNDGASPLQPPSLAPDNLISSLGTLNLNPIPLDDPTDDNPLGNINGGLSLQPSSSSNNGSQDGTTLPDLSALNNLSSPPQLNLDMNDIDNPLASLTQPTEDDTKTDQGPQLNGLDGIASPPPLPVGGNISNPPSLPVGGDSNMPQLSLPQVNLDGIASPPPLPVGGDSNMPTLSLPPLNLDDVGSPLPLPVGGNSNIPLSLPQLNVEGSEESPPPLPVGGNDQPPLLSPVHAPTPETASPQNIAGLSPLSNQLNPNLLAPPPFDAVGGIGDENQIRQLSQQSESSHSSEKQSQSSQNQAESPLLQIPPSLDLSSALSPPPPQLDLPSLPADLQLQLPQSQDTQLPSLQLDLPQLPQSQDSQSPQLQAPPALQLNGLQLQTPKPEDSQQLQLDLPQLPQSSQQPQLQLDMPTLQLPQQIDLPQDAQNAPLQLGLPQLQLPQPIDIDGDDAQQQQPLQLGLPQLQLPQPIDLNQDSQAPQLQLQLPQPIDLSQSGQQLNMPQLQLPQVSGQEEQQSNTNDCSDPSALASLGASTHSKKKTTKKIVKKKKGKKGDDQIFAGISIGNVGNECDDDGCDDGGLNPFDF